VILQGYITLGKCDFLCDAVAICRTAIETVERPLCFIAFPLLSPMSRRTRSAKPKVVDQENVPNESPLA